MPNVVESTEVPTPKDLTEPQTTSLEWPGGVFNAAARLLISGDGRMVQLTPKESDCLRVLASAAGCVVSITELSARVWYHESPSTTGTYQQALRSLRRKLCSSGLEISIETIRGSGYRLTIPSAEPGPGRVFTG